MAIWNILWYKLFFLFPSLFNYYLDLLIQSFHTIPKPGACRFGDGNYWNKCTLWNWSLRLVNSCMVAVEWRLSFFLSVMSAAVFTSLQLLAEFGDLLKLICTAPGC